MTPDLPTILTIGNFDGLHLGHRKLISTAKALARSWGGRAVLITFTPHPRQFFQAVPHFFIHPGNIREKLLESLKLDEIIYLPFGDIYKLSPEAFFDDILMPLEPAAIVLGDNFTFGNQKSGDIVCLRKLCAAHNVALHSLPRATFENKPISSSRIRTAIQCGDVRHAADMLGAPYALYDTVRHGAHRGHTLGFATANIHAENQVLPKIGVYATRVSVDGSPGLLKAVTAVTQTPTFGCIKTIVETHILDFDRSIYDHALCVRFDEFLRDEYTFCSKDALIKQLAKDCDTARTTLPAIPTAIL